MFDDFAVWLWEERHLSECTVRTKLVNLNKLRKSCNLWDLKAVKKFIANQSWGNNYKSLVELAYLDFCRFNGSDYQPTKYAKDTKIPYVPLECDIDAVIAGFRNSKYAPLIQLLKESGFRPEEGFRLTPNDFDLQARICTLNLPAKHSNPRQFRMSERLVNMLSPLIANTPAGNRIWSGTSEHIKNSFRLTRNRIARDLGNTRLFNVTLGSLRHYVGTKLYRETRDIILVQQRLGHKSILNTMVYINLIAGESEDGWTCRVAKSIDEASQLIEQGFEFVVDYEGSKMFRKRK
ncbi:site-specific integrase [Candidatus Bathyarchaeota archaeon]|nr:site-specific integrase [Candidatus Bathyarchaeota archaeon]